MMSAKAAAAVVRASLKILRGIFCSLHFLGQCQQLRVSQWLCCCWLFGGLRGFD